MSQKANNLDHTDWNERDEAAWEEFKKRMDSKPYLEFYPRAEDLRLGEYRGFGVSLRIWLRHVLFTFPLDLITTIWNGVKAIGMGFAGLGMGLAGLIVSPFMMIFHRILLTIAALGGRLWIVPQNTSIAAHLNYRMHSIRIEMEQDGYVLDKFFQEIEPTEISAETRTHLLRRWPEG